MDHLLSKTESYSRAFTEKVTGDYFSGSDTISGDQILKVTPIEQVNLFIIKNLFDKWKEESEKLRSPYFDYDKPEVKAALESFLITLSKNISIKREFFKPLLQKAIHDTLILLLKPDQFFQNEFNNSSISIGALKDQKKYFRIGRGQVDLVVTMMESEGKELIQTSFLVQRLKDIFQEQPIPEEAKQKVLADLSSVLPFEIQSDIDIKKEEKPEEEIAFLKPAMEVKSLKEEGKTINEKFAGNQLTLNDVLKSSDSISLAEKIGKSKVQSIREVISLNQKFMFITTLFQGERTEYENALNQIERSSTYEEAFEYLQNNYASRYHWENGKPELLELKEIIYRKFS